MHLTDFDESSMHWNLEPNDALIVETLLGRVFPEAG